MKRRSALPAHPAHWPLAARAILLLAVALACAATGLFLYVQPRSALRQAAENLRHDQQSRLLAALEKVAELPALRSQENLLDMQLLSAQEPLWSGDSHSVAGLLQLKLARRAQECGLEMESFKPLAPAQPATHAEIELSGEYAGLLRFVELVTEPPLPVQVESMELALHAARAGRQTLLMKVVLGAVLRDAEALAQP
ncbi:type 4a pilus biogenesis protein PilO [Herbaspirillum sp. SJZ099]|uniref:type 4a pilus biogenesis protein PilO n=1 Tax=Herbaspirillum sp. SJZ099 TaxID=2572916 RepID=UPI0011A33EC2|nr:type 4a pilus biogenesis protein PilO [Herbaspirillum sp. SJZ099]TWC69837.1 Tfp pilus assembly protein PilO [Herbaspirillum sp. SJZ099]